MMDLRTYLNGLTVHAQHEFARRCGTSLTYLRKAASRKQKHEVDLCIAIEMESGGAVRVEELRPDVRWGYLRGTSAQRGMLCKPMFAHVAPPGCRIPLCAHLDPHVWGGTVQHRCRIGKPMHEGCGWHTLAEPPRADACVQDLEGEDADTCSRGGL